MAPTRLTLAEQIAQLEQTAPADLDFEDLHISEAEVDNDFLEESASRAHYVDVGSSTLRNSLSTVPDPKYEGKRMSRKDLEDSGDGTSASESGESQSADNDDDEQEGDGRSAAADSEDEPSGDEDAMSVSKHVALDHREVESHPTKRKRQSVTDVVEQSAPLLNLQKAREDDSRKGAAVKRQLALWDTLLNTRIRLQKAVTSANSLPDPSSVAPFLNAPECQDAVSKFLDESVRLLDELDDLQQNLIDNNEVPTQNPPPKRRKLGADPALDEYTGMLAAASSYAAEEEESLHPYVLKTLAKWSSKIQAVAPSALIPSNRGAFLKGQQQPKSAIQLIDETLADNSKILERTRTQRAKSNRIGVSSSTAQEGSVDYEIFDDTDFYHKMLRDIIDSRKDGDGNEDWLVLQKQKKAKKKVDTKASKGRKLRFEVHEKIQNFMVPVPVPGAWHDEQIDELFASLLGKGFENVSLNPEPQIQSQIESTGFRVFG